jgi:putative oxidoreductase
MKFVYIAARVIVGLIFLIFGLNGFLQFLPLPELPPAAGEFMGGLMKAGYFFPLLKATEVVCGILFLTNRFAALAAVIIAPISLNILLFHVFLEPTGSPVGIVLTVGTFVIAWENWSKYSQLFKAN